MNFFCFRFFFFFLLVITNKPEFMLTFFAIVLSKVYLGLTISQIIPSKVYLGLTFSQIIPSKQWRNVNHVYHSAEIFGTPSKYKIFTVSWSFLYPLELFVPQIFFPHHRTLIWPTYGTFLQPNNFNSKFWRLLLMAPPATPTPLLAKCISDCHFLKLYLARCISDGHFLKLYLARCILDWI